MDHSSPTPSSSKLNRTAEWVQLQSAVRYSTQSYDPPPSPTLPSPTAVSRTSSSTRTTSCSDQSLAGPSTLKRRGPPPSPAHTNPIPSPLCTSPSVLHDGQRAFPFPQSPPGSGYPLAMEVVTPRGDTSRVRAAYCLLWGLGLMESCYSPLGLRC